MSSRFKNVPDRIYLVTGIELHDRSIDFKELFEVTWSEDKVFESDIVYYKDINDRGCKRGHCDNDSCTSNSNHARFMERLENPKRTPKLKDIRDFQTIKKKVK